MRARFIASLVLCATGLPAHSTILDGKIVQQSGAGKFVILDAGCSFAVGNDTFDNDNLNAFDEDQNITLIEPIRVDLANEKGYIPAGTTIASHYVFFDSLNGIHIGYVDFDADVLGVAAFQDTLAATDFLANNDVTYISTALRGLEEGDRVWVDPENPQRLWVYWAGSSPGDYIRVFTKRSPTALMM
jgi:hypothetical protein